MTLLAVDALPGWSTEGVSSIVSGQSTLFLANGDTARTGYSFTCTPTALGTMTLRFQPVAYMERHIEEGVHACRVARREPSCTRA